MINMYYVKTYDEYEVKLKNDYFMRKNGKRSTRSIFPEGYEPVQNWAEVPDCYSNLLLREREYTVIIDPRTGRGVYVIARLGNVIRYTAYIDRSPMKQGFLKVPFQELKQRKRK
jgi:hypothetical protein